MKYLAVIIVALSTNVFLSACSGDKTKPPASTDKPSSKVVHDRNQCPSNVSGNYCLISEEAIDDQGVATPKQTGLSICNPIKLSANANGEMTFQWLQVEYIVDGKAHGDYPLAGPAKINFACSNGVIYESTETRIGSNPISISRTYQVSEDGKTLQYTEELKSSKYGNHRKNETYKLEDVATGN